MPLYGAPPFVVTFTESSEPSEDITYWAWDFGDGTTFEGQNPAPHLYNTPGVYTVTLNVASANGIDTFTDSVVVMVLPEGLVGYWPLTERSGIRHDTFGVHNLSDPTGVGSEPGPAGLAAVFDRADGNYLATPMTDALMPGAASAIGATWSLWFKTSDRPAFGQVLLGDLGGATSARAISMSALGTPRAWLYGTDHVDDPWNAGTWVATETAVDCADGLWHFAAMTYDLDGKVRLYVDGAPPIVSPDGAGFAAPLWLPPRFAEIGEWRVGAGDVVPPVPYFTGSIQHVGLWNRALTEQEILSLWNGGSGFSLGV
jgi:PKD repeat protein